MTPSRRGFLGTLLAGFTAAGVRANQPSQTDVHLPKPEPPPPPKQVSSLAYSNHDVLFEIGPRNVRPGHFVCLNSDGRVTPAEFPGDRPIGVVISRPDLQTAWVRVSGGGSTVGVYDGQ